MTTLTESFNKADSAVIGPDQTWVISATGSGSEVYSQAFSNSSGVGGYAHALIDTSLTDDEQSLTMTIVAVNDTAGFGDTFELFLRDLEDVENAVLTTFGFWASTWASLNGVAYLQVTCETTDASFYQSAQIPFASPVVNDTYKFAVSGTGDSTTAVITINGVVAATVTALDLVAPAVLLPLSPSRVGLAITSFTAHTNRMDGLTATASATPGPVDHKLPALSSDVPYLQANDRYQVVACVNRGDSTHAPEFRYWYAGAPSWDESV